MDSRGWGKDKHSLHSSESKWKIQNIILEAKVIHVRSDSVTRGHGSSTFAQRSVAFHLVIL